MTSDDDTNSEELKYEVSPRPELNRFVEQIVIYALVKTLKLLVHQSPFLSLKIKRKEMKKGLQFK